MMEETSRGRGSSPSRGTACGGNAWMDGAFACPDCGCEIRLTGLSPGRMVPCDWCGATVEVPFLPRADQIKRLRRRRESRRRRRTYWAWVGLGATVLAVLIVIAEA